MMFLKSCLFGIFLMVFLPSCSESSDESLFEVDPQHFINTWIHNGEGSCSGMTMIYETYDTSYLDSWRTRNRMNLFEDGKAFYAIGSQRDPHLDDQVANVHGTWTFEPDTNTLLIHGADGKPVFAFQVNRLRDGFLKMTYIPVPPDLLAK